METVTVSSEEFESTDLDKEKTSSPKGLKTVTVSSEEFEAVDRYGDIPSFSPTGERISELPEKDTTDLLGYGYAKSRTLTGEAGRWLHDVAVGALDSDMTIEEVRQKREAERQEEIFEDYPWARTGEYDTNPWVVTGEIGGSLVDPLTLLPGVAAVKTAHTASTALKVGRATFTGGSEAYLYSTLLQENTEGKVDQSEAATVGLFGAAFGGSVGWGSLKLKSWYDNYKKVHGKDPNVIEIQDFLLANEIEFSPVEKGGYNIGAVPETLKESDKSIKYKRIGGTYDYLGELEYKELNSINKQIDELHLKTPSERWDEVKRLNENHNQAEEAYRNGKMDVEDWDAHRASYNTRVISTFEDILNKSADIKIKGLENIFESSKKADLTDHALTQIMNVVTRPIFGGGAGYSLGMIQGDPGDEVNYMLIGASLGALQKAVRSSRRIDNTTKKKLDALINVSGLRHIRNIYHNLSSSTHAAHLNSRQGQALKVWSRANFHQQVESGAGKGKGAIRGTREASVEERATLAEGAWMNALFTDVFKRTDSLADREAAVRVMWGFGSKEDKAKPEVRHIVKGLKHFLSEFQEYHQTAGIKQGAEYTNFFFRTFKTAEISMDKEGFSRDVYKIFLGKKNPKTGKYYTAKEARKLTRNYVKGTSTRNKATGDKGSDDFIFDGIPLLRHIETQRQLTGTYLDRVTGKEMSVEHGLQDWLVMDPAVVLRDVIPQSTKAVEFARTWGPNGELIKVIKGGIHSHHNAIGLGKAQQREKSYDLQLLRESIDAMFGQHGESIKASGIREAFAWLNGAVNMNMLETVSIANLGDLLQIWQNSSLKSAYQAMPKPFSKRGATALRAKDETGLAKTLAIDVSDALSRELKTMIGSNSDTVLLQKGQEGFFTLTGLRGVTSLARRWAFNVGTHEAYNLSVKYAKLSTKQLTKGKAKLLRQKLNFLGITPDEALKIGKVSSYEDIMNSSDSEILTLIKQAGFRTAERDAKIPTVGNRRLFTQSNNEAVRMLGGLLSWAQAKGTQMNGLLSRIEGGDKVLAVKVAAMLPVYASLMGFRKWLESGMEGGVDGLIESTPENLMAEGMLFSGAIPWQVTTTYSPLEGYTKDNPLAMFPATNLLAKASKAVQGEGYWRDTLPLPKLWKLMFGDPREERQTVPSYGLPQKESKPTYSTGGYVSEMSQLGFNEGGVASSREANATLSDQLISLGKKGGEYIDETIDRAKTLVTPSAWVEALTTFPKVDLETEELPEYDMETIMNSLPITGITKPAHMMLLKMKKNPNLTIENRIKALKKLGKADRKTESKELLDILSDIKVDYPEMAKGYQAQIAKVMNTPAPKVTSKDIAEQLKKTKTKPKKSKQPTSEQANIAHVPNMSQATFAKQVAKFDSKVDDIINNGTRREINKLLYEQVGNRKGTEAFAIDKFHLALKKREYQEKLARDRAYRAQQEQRKVWRESRDEIRGKPKDKKYKHGGLFSQFAGGGAVEQQMHKLLPKKTGEDLTKQEQIDLHKDLTGRTPKEQEAYDRVEYYHQNPEAYEKEVKATGEGVRRGVSTVLSLPEIAYDIGEWAVTKLPKALYGKVTEDEWGDWTPEMRAYEWAKEAYADDVASTLTIGEIDRKYEGETAGEKGALGAGEVLTDVTTLPVPMFYGAKVGVAGKHLKNLIKEGGKDVPHDPQRRLAGKAAVATLLGGKLVGDMVEVGKTTKTAKEATEAVSKGVKAFDVSKARREWWNETFLSGNKLKRDTYNYPGFEYDLDRAVLELRDRYPKVDKAYRKEREKIDQTFNVFDGHKGAENASEAMLDLRIAVVRDAPEDALDMIIKDMKLDLRSLGKEHPFGGFFHDRLSANLKAIERMKVSRDESVLNKQLQYEGKLRPNGTTIADQIGTLLGKGSTSTKLKISDVDFNDPKYNILLKEFGDDVRDLVKKGYSEEKANDIVGKAGLRHIEEVDAGGDPKNYYNVLEDEIKKADIKEIKKNTSKLYLDKAEGKEIKLEMKQATPEEMDTLFVDVADTQRGEPERFMVQTQHKLGGGVMNVMIEHIGDLTHRMAQRHASEMYMGHQWVSEKVHRGINYLEHGYGFHREFLENMEANEVEIADALALLRRYAAQHTKIPAYNRPQWLARESAISLGRGQYSDTLKHLKELRTLLEDPDVWVKEASKISRDSNGNVVWYIPNEAPKKYAKGGIVTNEELGDHEYVNPLVDEWAKRTKTDVDTTRSTMREIQDYIKEKESEDKNVYQKKSYPLLGRFHPFDPTEDSRGPGTGFYQYETKSGDGSGASKTAVKRTINSLKNYGFPVPSWLQKLSKEKDPDFTKLSEQQQDYIFIGDKQQERGTDALFKQIVGTKDKNKREQLFYNFWKKKHHKGK